MRIRSRRIETERLSTDSCLRIHWVSFILMEIDIENKIISIPLDELKRSTDDVAYSDFLLPQWQYDELAEDDEE